MYLMKERKNETASSLPEACVNGWESNDSDVFLKCKHWIVLKCIGIWGERW